MKANDIHSKLLGVAQNAVRQIDRHPRAGLLIKGTLSAQDYIHYLIQVVHQVRGSAPLLQRAANRLACFGTYPRLEALYREKANEEDGHDLWALDDLASLGVARDVALVAQPCVAVHAYQAWACYLTEVAPIGVLGLAFVLEWFGHVRAGPAADNLVRVGAIVNISSAVSFLRKHGEADAEHIEVLAAALADVRHPEDVETVLLSARLTAALYLGFFEADYPKPSGEQRVKGTPSSFASAPKP